MGYIQSLIRRADMLSPALHEEDVPKAHITPREVTGVSQ